MPDPGVVLTSGLPALSAGVGQGAAAQFMTVLAWWTRQHRYGVQVS